MYILSIYEQERNMSRLVRVSDSVRHAQAYGLARRVIQRAASCVPATALVLTKVGLCFLGGRGFHFGTSGVSFWGGLGPHFGRSGAPFWHNFGVWAGSGSQMRLWKRFGRLLGDFKSQDGSNLRPKMAPNWSQNGIKIDAKITQFFDAFENRFLVEFWWI